MEPTKELAEEIYRDRVLRARKLSEGEKIAIGIELFEGATGLMRDGIRHQFPGATATRIDEILRERLDRLRRVREHGIFRAAHP